MLDLARHLGLGRSSVTGLVDRAAARGLVERVTAPGDGRGVHVWLTADGRARLAERLTEQGEGALSGCSTCSLRVTQRGSGRSLAPWWRARGGPRRRPRVGLTQTPVGRASPARSRSIGPPSTVTSGIGPSAQPGGSTPRRSAAMRAKWRSNRPG